MKSLARKQAVKSYAWRAQWRTLLVVFKRLFLLPRQQFTSLLTLSRISQTCLWLCWASRPKQTLLSSVRVLLLAIFADRTNVLKYEQDRITEYQMRPTLFMKTGLATHAKISEVFVVIQGVSHKKLVWNFEPDVWTRTKEQVSILYFGFEFVLFLCVFRRGSCCDNQVEYMFTYNRGDIRHSLEFSSPTSWKTSTKCL